MPNITVDSAKLVLNAFASIFQNNLVSKDVVTWKEYDGELNDRNALTVVEQIGPRYTVTQTSAGVANLSSGTQDTVFGSEQFVVNQTFGSSMGWNDFQKIQNVGDARESQALKNAAVNLAEKIDGYILGVTALASSNWVYGTVGNNLSALNDVLSGYTRLKEEGVEDGDIRIVGTYADKQALGVNVTTLPALMGFADGVYRKGFEGEVGGFPILWTQQLPTLTTGSALRTSASTVDGSDQNVNYADVAVSTGPGKYKTQSLIIKTSSSGTETTVAGDVFTIADVYAWDERANQALPYLRQFTVVTGGTSVSGSQTITIYPAIIVQGTEDNGGTTTVNTANATVDSIPGETAEITWVGAASTAYKPRVMLHKEAVVVNTVPLIMPATGKAAMRALTKVPLTVRMWQNSTFATGEHDVRFDVALTANIRDRRRMVRLSGT